MGSLSSFSDKFKRSYKRMHSTKTWKNMIYKYINDYFRIICVLIVIAIKRVNESANEINTKPIISMRACLTKHNGLVAKYNMNPKKVKATIYG